MEIWPDLEVSTVKSVEDLVGIPFKSEGRTLDGADCWGIVTLYYNLVLGKKIHSYMIDADDFARISETMLSEIHTSKWEILDKPEPNCIALMRLGYCSAPINHAGVILPSGRLLQSYESTGSIIVDPTNPLWSRIIKFYIKPRCI